MSDINQPDKKDTLAAQIASYLKSRREEVGLSQKQLALRGKQRGVTFDNSWVSQWERLGPKPSFLKALAYLRLIDADIELIQEMARAKVVLPADSSLSSEEITAKSRALLEEGRLAEALGLAVHGAESAKTDESRAQLWLAASIVTRRADLFSLARHFALLAENQLDDSTDSSLAARIQTQLASLDTHQGDYESAEARLRALLENEGLDRVSKAYALQSFAYMESCRESGQSVVELLQEALTAYPREASGDNVSRVLARLGGAHFKLGEHESGKRVSADAIRLSERRPLLRIFTLLEAGRGYTQSRDFKSASKCLRDAERIAQEFGTEIRLFEIRLALLELAVESKNCALEAMIKKRLRSERTHLKLPASLADSYSRLVESASDLID